MNIIAQIISGLQHLFSFIDEIHTSEEEKLKHKAELMQLYQPILVAAVDFEKAQMIAQIELAKAEAQSQSTITRMWRPILALSIGSIPVVHYYGALFGAAALPPVPEPVWTIIYVFLGIYGAGRSVEKFLPPLIGALKGKEN